MPDNAVYYRAAYATAAGLHGAYVASLIWRARKLRAAGNREMGNGA